MGIGEMKNIKKNFWVDFFVKTFPYVCTVLIYPKIISYSPNWANFFSFLIMFKKIMINSNVFNTYNNL